MAGYTLNINGRISLEALTINKVNKYYTMQNEFMREPSVLATRSKKGSSVYMVTIPFDATNVSSVSDMMHLINMFKVYPYVFIESIALESEGATVGNQAIGDSFYMYALLEYEIEATVDNQGNYLVSFTLQPVNWKSLCKSISFLSYSFDEDEDGNISNPQVSFHNNPGDSNVLAKMIAYSASGNSVTTDDLILSAKTTGQHVTLGFPVIGGYDTVKDVTPKLGEIRSFRVLNPTKTNKNDTTGASAVDSTKQVATEIEAMSPLIDDDEVRVYVAYRGVEIRSNEDSAIQSVVVRKRNRFANQAISDWVLPFPQYLGKTPSEVLVTSVSKMTDIDALSPVRIVDSMNSFAEVVRSSYPFLMGIDAMRIGNPLINLMGVSSIIVDSTHTSMESRQNDIAIHNYTFIESDSTLLMDRSRYTLSSESINKDAANKIATLLELIGIVEAQSKDGTPAEIAAIKLNLLTFKPYIDKEISSETEALEAQYKEYIEQSGKDMSTFKFSNYVSSLNKSTGLAPSSRVLGATTDSETYRNATDLTKVKMVLELLQSKYSKISELNDVEQRAIEERLRSLISGVNNTYLKTITANPFNKYIQQITLREIQKEQERIEQYADNIVLRGEAAPDLFIQDMFRDYPEDDEMDSWRSLSTIPFVYDASYIDPKKLRALWDREKPRIDKEVENLSGYLVNKYGQAPENFPIYNGETTGEMSDFAATLGPSKDASTLSESVPTDTGSYTADSTGAWQIWSHALAGAGTNRNNFGQVRKYSSGIKGHQGVDISLPPGKGIRSLAPGSAAQQLQSGGNSGWGAYVTVTHANNIITRYAHNSKWGKKGSVTTQDIIAYSGGAKGTWGAGTSTGGHLHLEIRHNNVPLDPIRFRRNDPSTWYTTGSSSASNLGKNYTYKYNPSNFVAAKVASKSLGSTSSTTTSAVTQSSGGTSPFSSASREKEVLNAASAIAQTYTGPAISGLSMKETKQLVGSIGALESTGNQKAVNSYGYAGLYQMGTMALQEAGFVKKGIGSSNSLLNNARNWTISGGLPAFLNSRELQDKAIAAYANKNVQYLTNTYKENYAGMDTTTKMTYLASMHNGGMGAGYKAIKNGTNAKDGNGTSHANYAKQVLYASGRATTSGSGVVFKNSYGEDQLDEIAGARSGEMKGFDFNPIPWNETFAAELRLNNLSRDFSVGLQKLIPTYKVYIVYGNNENSIDKLIDPNAQVKMYEVPAVRNIRVETANQDNPIAVASFEVMNPLNTAVSPIDQSVAGGRVKVDATSLSSDFSYVSTYDQVRLKAGNKIQIRLGYGNDPNALDIVFNGVISESTSGEIAQIVAEGYGRELQNEILFDTENSFLNSITSESYISDTIGKILKNANLENFGKRPRLFGEGTGSGKTDSDTNGVNSYGFDIQNNSLLDLANGQLLFTDFMGPSDTLENYYLSNLDVITMWWGEGKFVDIFPFSTRNFKQDFRVANKTVWEVLVTGTRLFPASIRLVKNLGSRCTTFVGIKEQSMVARPVNNSLIKAASENTDSGLSSDGTSDDTVMNDVLDFLSNSVGGAIIKETINYITGTKTSQDMIEEASTLDPVSTSKISQLLKDYYRLPDSAWGPATNFHILSSSYNVISNQIRLNSSINTAVSVEYGDDIETFNYGVNDQFKLKANGNLSPMATKEFYLSDTTIESKDMAMRTAQGVLIEELEKMYDGAIIVTGNALIQSGDYAYIHDDMRSMTGVIKCREVYHAFTEQDGFITVIKPGMFVEPATHLYSLLYMKFGIFSAYVTESMRQVRLASSATMGIGGVFSNVLMANDVATLLDVSAYTAVNTAAVAATTYSAYSLGRGLLTRYGPSVYRGLSAAVSWARATSVASAVSTSRAAAVVMEAANLGRSVITGVAMFGGIGAAIPAIVIGVIVSIVAGTIWNIVDGFIKTKRLQHKALLKFPVVVNGKEYVAGLQGWNDDKGIIETEWNNIKTTFNNLMSIKEAASSSVSNAGTTGGARLFLEVLRD